MGISTSKPLQYASRPGIYTTGNQSRQRKEERVLNRNPCRGRPLRRQPLPASNVKCLPSTTVPGGQGADENPDGVPRPPRRPRRGSGPARACERASERGASRPRRVVCARPAVRAAAGRLRVRAGRERRAPARVGVGCAPHTAGMYLISSIRQNFEPV